MNRIDKSFENTKSLGEIALVCFITAGDPDLATTVDVVKTLAEAGADVVELGCRFPTLSRDGPSIQRRASCAAERRDSAKGFRGRCGDTN